MNRLVSLLTGLCLWTYSAVAQDTLAVLFIGNEYSSLNSLPSMVEQIANSLDNVMEWYAVTPDGYTLEQHAQNAQTLTALSVMEWDFVVIQEDVVRLGFDNSSFASEVVPFAQDLCDGARASSPCVKPVFMMPWAGKTGDPLNCLEFPWVCTNEEQSDTLRSRTLHLAIANDAWCAPVGEAWNWLIDLSDDSIPMYDGDGVSPTPPSTYLTACVLYSVLFQELPDGAYYPGQLGEEEAELIQAVAGNTVIGSADEWNFTPFVWADLSFDVGPIFTTITLEASAAVDSVLIEIDDLSLVWEPGVSGAFTFDGGWNPYFLTIYSLCGNAELLDSVNIPVSIAEIPSAIELAPYPNPVSGEVTLPVSEPGRYDAILIDSRGSIVRRIMLRIDSAGAPRLDMSNLPSGVYQWHVYNDHRRYVLTCVKD